MSVEALPSGTRLEGNLEIRRVLGRGGFGITYLVHDHDLERDFVVKEFFPHGLARRAGVRVVALENSALMEDFRHFLGRFRDEARMAASIDHPNLVKVHRYFAANGTGYFQMDWHEGETLQTLLKRQPTLSASEVVKLVGPLLDGLQRLHEAQLIHRDIKPGNIYLRSNGQPLLLDFGAARTAANGCFSPQLTVILSPGYVPLEQYSVDGSAQGPHSDIYGVGAVMYRLLTGSDPDDAKKRSAQSNEERLRASCSARAPAHVPRALCDVVDRAMAVDAGARIADAPALRREVLAAMASHAGLVVQSGPPAGPGSPSAPAATAAGRWTRPALVSVAALLAIAFVGVSIGWRQNRLQPAAEASRPAAAAMPAPPRVASPPGQESSPPPSQSATAAAAAALPPVDDMVQKIRASLADRDLTVTVALDPPRSSFVEGELISIGFSTREAAYALVFVYSQDRSVTMLYPNDYAEGEKVKPDVMNWVGGERKFVIRVVPPFGVDTIHVVAFRNPDDVKLLLGALDIKKTARDLFAIERSSLERSISALRSRGLAVEKRNDAIQEGARSGWGDAVAAIATRAGLH
ncbi:serine/threonine protein kinase [Tahibacter aquaticus]|uniref:Serine/threonine protein kinase n=1 Tax=Tahibacter aquaticus TaxID=520092 RepID=A0A4R6YU33_9GAMM|nr:serine/threonine protein kinase [Tahibacter aquaticus]TDR42030.1 serine/threonine protein kinase [Tahibacter aquaticus]